MKNINKLVRVLVGSACHKDEREYNVVCSPIDAAYTEGVKEKQFNPTNILCDLMELDADEFKVDRISDEEGELGLINGEGYLNDMFRMHDEAGITMHQLDEERQLELDESLLILARQYFREHNVPRTQWSYKFNRKVDSQEVKAGKRLAKQIQERIFQMDNERKEVEQEEETDNIRSHFETLHDIWAAKERALETQLTKWGYDLNGKQIARLCDMYKRLWKEYRNPEVKIRKLDKNPAISYWWFANLRKTISMHLYLSTNSTYWQEKAEKDVTSFLNTKGRLNKAGTNIPEKYIDIESISRKEERLFCGAGNPEDNYIRDFDRKYFGCVEERTVNTYTLPTGAANVDVADAVYALSRNEGNRKLAAEELEISLSTLDRRISKAREIILNSTVVNPELAEAISKAL